MCGKSFAGCAEDRQEALKGEIFKFIRWSGRNKINQNRRPPDTREGQEGEERKMKSTVSYKNYVIRAESFQREKSGDWIPQYNFTRQNIASKGNDFPAQQYQLNEALPTEDAADDFALRKAMEWIDKN
jgi:hypothetical protein